MSTVRTAIVLLLAAATAMPNAAHAQAVAPVRCLFAALDAHDFAAMTACYAPSAVTVRAGRRVPLDFEATRGYRAFEAATQARFSFDVRAATDSVADIVLHEESEFLRALGLAEVTADWRYVVRGGVIVEEHHLRADSAYAVRYRAFAEWGRREQPPQWQSVLDGYGNVVFNGATAHALVALARQWSASRRPPDDASSPDDSA